MNPPPLPASSGLLLLRSFRGIITTACWILASGTPHANAASYDAAGRLSKVETVNGPSTVFTYDAAANIMAMTTAAAGTALQLTSDPVVTGYLGTAFTYTAKSNKTGVTYTGTGLPPGLTLKSTGAISGKPTVAGAYAIPLTLKTATQQMTETLFIHIRPVRQAPTVLRQPESMAVIFGQPVTLFADVAGSQPMTYQWKRGSTMLASATSPSLSIPAFAAENEGDYVLTAKNAVGSVTTLSARLARLQPLAFNGEPYGLPLVFSGNANWFSQTAFTFDGSTALRSGAIGSNQQSVVSVQLTGPGTLKFRQAVSSEANYDELTFTLDGQAVASVPEISGQVSWTPFSVTIPAGAHTAVWTYSKDGSSISGQDAAWLADAYFTPGLSLDILAQGGGQVTRSPAAPSYTAGQAVTMTAVPDPGRYFAGWGGDATGTTNPFKITLKTPMQVTALFKENLGFAIGLPGIHWATGGNADWISQPFDVQDGAVGGKSGDVGDGESSWVETTVTGPGTIVFSWKVSSELDKDFLSFAVDGKSRASISGTTTWASQSHDIPAGTHQLRWTYSKDDSGSSGEDATWLDGVRFLPVLPWAQLGGGYYGTAAADVVTQSAGAASFTITTSGALSGSVGFQNKPYSLKGSMSYQGGYALTILRSKMPSLQVRLQLDTATLTLNGTISDGLTTAEITTWRAIYSTKVPAPHTGLWPLATEPVPDSPPQVPGGYGYGSVNMAKTGVGTVAGNLPEGTKFTGSAYLAATGQAPYFISLYTAKGFLIGRFDFTSTPLLGGVLHWSRPSLPLDKNFKQGFETDLDVEGSVFVYPAANIRLLPYADKANNGQLTLGVDVLAPTMSSLFTLDKNNKIAFPTPNNGKYALTLAKTGLFSGSFYDAVAKKTRSFKGAVLQQQKIGLGHFLDVNLSAKAVVDQAP